MNDSDKSLIHGCQSGDRQAWERLILRYERLIYSVALRSGLGEDDAGDVFQTVCVALLEHLEKVRDDEHLRAWLITTAKHESWRVVRLRSRHTSYDDMVRTETDDSLGGQEDTDPLPLEAAVKIAEEQIVRQAVEELGATCKRLLQMLYHTDPAPSYIEIARQLDVSEGAIGPTRARCLQKLKRILLSQGF